ncbi:MAG: electron transport complex subunit RsxC [Clostridia bacterium]|nr:electron transport complex subunit RsxC [Clostridia bacterium]
MRFFKGGVHPYDGKELSKNKPVSKLDAGEELVFPMQQHIGAPAAPCLKKGDSVLVGQIIGTASGFVSANILSSVSGTVKALEPRAIDNGTKVMSVVVTNDFEYRTVEGFGKDKSYEDMDRDSFLEAVKNAGIVGMGGANFPAHIKLAADPEKIDRIIVNASECEPYLTSDYRAMLERAEEIIGGLSVILHFFPKASGVIAVEDNKSDAAEHIQSLIGGQKNISLKVLQTKYPQGAERMLIYAVTGRQINSKMLPADAGCIVHNIDTVCSIYRAICKSIPSIRRIITVTGDAITNPQNFDAPLGMSFREVVDAAGGFKTNPQKIISGGPMMGKSISSLDIPITKGTTSVLALTKDQASAKSSNCIRCGRCVKACPEHLVPQKISVLAAERQYDEFIKWNGTECVGCGCCSYVCPAKRPLSQEISTARAKSIQLLKSRK